MPKIRGKFIFLIVFPVLALFCHPPTVLAAARTSKAETPAPEQFPPLDEMLGAMLMFGFRGAELAPDDAFLTLVAQGRMGNVILFDRDVSAGSERNIRSPEQLAKLCATLKKSARHPIFIGVDQEGGQVRRLKPKAGFMDLPSAQRMGQESPHATFEMADRLGRELAGLGVNLDLAPVADVDTNPFNPAIGKLGRAFSSDAKLAAGHALAFGRGLAKNGVAPALKHFPGQGCATADTHLGAADVSQCWSANIDLLPFAEIIHAGWPGMIMIGHIHLKNLDPDLPATLSRNIVTGLLREGLGWEGVVISDDLQMKAVWEGRDLKEIISQAINAGVDILLFGNNLEWDGELPQKVWSALRGLVDSGELSEDRVRQSWRRISALHAAYSQPQQEETQ